MDNILDKKMALDLFYENAKKQALATENGDYKNGNENVDKIRQAIIYLKETNSLSDLFDFLKNNSVGVRLWTATYLLPIYEKECIKVLEDIINGNKDSIHSFDAEMVLSEWKKGSLNL